MATDTKIPQLIINEMTRAQYEALTEVSESEIYVITDDEATVVTNGTNITGTGTTSDPIALSQEIVTKIDNNTTNLSTHTLNESNPHKVTKAQIGLGNVDNTSDANKPISTATQTALDLKADKSSVYDKTEISGLLETKQDTLEAGDGIEIKDGIISNTRVSAEWGNVEGTLSNQTDLQSALDLKANQSTTYTKTETDSAIETALTDYVKNTDYATSDVAGVIKQSTTYGFSVNENTGVPFASTKGLTGYQNGDGNMFIGKNTLENIKDDLVKRGVTENAITLTDTEKSAARTWIGAGSQADVSSLGTNVSNITSLIPTGASSTNQLADKDFVNSSINNLAAFYLTSNVGGDAFNTKAALLAGPYYFQGEVRTATLNDYAIVLSDESKNNATTRYLYDGTQWDFQYIINDTPFTQEQVNAINSTITATLVGQYNTHIVNKENPHGVTAAQIGLGNVNNTSDLDKPISTATQTALDNHTNNKENPHGVTKAQVGLDQVDNTSDLNKPISTATQEALDLKANANEYIKKSGDTMTGTLQFQGSNLNASKFSVYANPDGNGLMFNGYITITSNAILPPLASLSSKDLGGALSSLSWENLYVKNIANGGGGKLAVPTEAGTLARIEDIPVSSVNSKTGDVVLNTEDINATNGEETITLQAALDLKANQSTTYTKTEVDNKIAEFEAFPDQTNNNGKILTTNGTETSWTDMPGLIIRRL